MITSVDTNIIMDVLIPGESFAQSSKTLVERYLAKGKLVKDLWSWFDLAAPWEGRRPSIFSSSKSALWIYCMRKTAKS